MSRRLVMLRNRRTPSAPRWVDRRAMADRLATFRRRAASRWARVRETFGADQRLIGVLAAASLFLQLRELDLATVSARMATTLATAASIARGEAAPLVGLAADRGLYHPAALPWLLAVPALLSRDPRVALALVSLANIAGMAGLYALVRRYHGRRAAFVAALFWVVNPWNVANVRSADAAALLPVAAVALLCGLYLGIVDRRPWGWTLAAAATGAMAALSLWGVPLAAGLALAVLLYARRVAWLHLLLGLCIALLAQSLYLYAGNLTRYAALRGALTDGAQGQGFWDGLEAVVHAAGGFFAGEDLPGLLTRTLPEALHWPETSRLGGWLGWLAVASLLALVPLGVRAWGHWKARRDPAIYLIPALCALGPAVALASLPLTASAGGVAALLPMGCVAAGVILVRLTGTPGRPRAWRRSAALVAQGATGFLLVALVAWQGAGIVYGQQNSASDEDAVRAGGVPLHFWRSTARMAQREAQKAGASQVWHLRQADAPEALDGALLPYLIGRRPRYVALAPGAAFLPAGRTGVYLRAGLASAAAADGGIPTGDEAGLVLGPEGTAQASVTVAEARSVDSILAEIPSEADAGYECGLRLLGYDWPADAAAGQTVVLRTWWTLDEISAVERTRAHRVTSRIETLDGTVIAEASGLGLAERDWSEGYLLVQQHGLSLPARIPDGELRLIVEAAALDASGVPVPARDDVVGETVAILGTVRVAQPGP